jgi:tRNA_anti-like
VFLILVVVFFGLIILLVIIASMVNSSGPQSTSSTSTSSSSSTRVGVAAEPATPEEPAISWREVDSIYSFKSNNTDLQKDESWKRFKGKRVAWSGVVSAVSDGWTGLTLQVKMNPDTFTSDLLIRLNRDEKSKAALLQKGDRVRFTGALKSWGTLLPITLEDGEILE